MPIDPYPEMLYAGKAVMLRNRLQQHEMLRRMWDDPYLCDDGDPLRVRVMAWYLPTQIECKIAEASLIRVLKPRYNDRGEGEHTWTIRPADVMDVDPMTLRPETRRELAEALGELVPCPIANRPGVYLWYMISEVEHYGILGVDPAYRAALEAELARKVRGGRPEVWDDEKRAAILATGLLAWTPEMVLARWTAEAEGPRP